MEPFLASGRHEGNHGYTKAVASDATDWVFLIYWLPRTPSAPRLALWRRLKRLGVAQLADGLVTLPADDRTREQLEWAAEQVITAGGTAGVWLATPTSRTQERAIVQAMSDARAGEYRAVAQKAQAALDGNTVDRARALRRLRAENRRISRRDFFGPPEREHARRTLDALAAPPNPTEVPHRTASRR